MIWVCWRFCTPKNTNGFEEWLLLQIPKSDKSLFFRNCICLVLNTYRIFLRINWWKKFENWSTFAKVINKYQVAYFFSRPCVCYYCICKLTRSVAAGFGRHGMPPPAANDTVQHWAKSAQTDHVTLRPWPLTLKVMARVADAGRRPPSVYQVWSS